MRSYNGNIERVTDKESESRFRRIAFNAMKKAKEGLMILTISAVMSTGFTNNIYGDENMGNGTKTIEEEKSTTTPKLKMGDKIATPIIQKEEQLKLMQMDVTQAFRTMNDKIACSEEGICMLPDAQTQLLNYFKTKNINGEEVITGKTLSEKIKENKYLKEKLDNVKVNEIANIVLLKFGEVPLTEINFEEINEKSVFLLYAAHFASYNEESGFIEKQNILSDKKLSKNKELAKLDELFNYAAYKNKVGPNAYQVIENVLDVQELTPVSTIKTTENPTIKMKYNSELETSLIQENAEYEVKRDTKGNPIGIEMKFNEFNRFMNEAFENPNIVREIRKNPGEFKDMTNEQIAAYLNEKEEAYGTEKADQIRKYAELLDSLKQTKHSVGSGVGLNFSMPISENWTLGLGTNYNASYGITTKEFSFKDLSVYGTIQWNPNQWKVYFTAGLSEIAQDWKSGEPKFTSTLGVGYEYEEPILLSTSATYTMNVMNPKEYTISPAVNLKMDYNTWYTDVSGKGSVGQGPFGFEWGTGANLSIGLKDKKENRYGLSADYYYRENAELFKQHELTVGPEFGIFVTDYFVTTIKFYYKIDITELKP